MLYSEGDPSEAWCSGHCYVHRRPQPAFTVRDGWLRRGDSRHHGRTPSCGLHPAADQGYCHSM